MDESSQARADPDCTSFIPSNPFSSTTGSRHEVWSEDLGTLEGPLTLRSAVILKLYQAYMDAVKL
jgi:hypothetical protein